MHNSTDLGRYSLQPLLSIQLLAVLFPKDSDYIPLKPVEGFPLTSLEPQSTQMLLQLLEKYYFLQCMHLSSIKITQLCFSNGFFTAI